MLERQAHCRRRFLQDLARRAGQFDRKRRSEHGRDLLVGLVKLGSIRLTPRSVENEAAMKVIATEATEQSIPVEDALRLVIDTTPALIHTGRPDGYLDYFNQHWLEFLGLPLQEVCGWRWTGAVHPEDVAGLLQKWHAALGNGEPLEAEARVRRADGEYRLLLHRKVPLRDEGGAILKWYGSSVDIEGQSEAQERILQDERERLSALLGEAQRLTRIGTFVQRFTRIGSFVFRLPDATEYWSPELFRIFGVDPAKGHPRNMSEYTAYVHPDDRERYLREAEEILAKGQAYEHDHRIVRPDGEIRVVRVVGCPVHDKGVVTRFIGAFADITEREQMNLELKRREFFLTEGQRLSHSGSWSLTPAGICDYWSRELYEIAGFDPAKGIPTISEFLTHVHPDDRERITKAIDQMLANVLGTDVKYRLVHPERGIRFVHGVGEPVYEEGLVTRYVGTILDVTEQERLTLELQRREAHLAQAQALSRTGSFGWNVSNGELYWSDETFRILEYKRTVKPMLELLFERVHPEDAATLQQTIERASKDAKNLDYEHRLLLPDGSIKHVHVLAQPFKDQSGNVEFVGTLMDVTDSKKAFEEIKALKDELYKENIVLREEVDQTSMFEEIVGTSPALQAVLAHAAKVAPTESTVLITGETGTGKELIARAIHKRSQRSTRAFVSVNCTALPQSLITSELFGHEKGAFTGATQRRLGRFELAEGGTLFLDEIGELPVETQIALLRVLQEREFERVGGTEPLRADVRLIAATNRDLQGAITAGTFRSDLFYRLNVFPIALPPLRERKEDIQPLVSYFVDRYAKRSGRKIRGIRKSGA
jgi:PAS domain S-box-containing protein